MKICNGPPTVMTNRFKHEDSGKDFHAIFHLPVIATWFGLILTSQTMWNRVCKRLLLRLLTVGNWFLSESLPSKSFQSCFPQEASPDLASNSKIFAIFLWEFLCTWAFFLCLSFQAWKIWRQAISGELLCGWAWLLGSVVQKMVDFLLWWRCSLG